MRFSVLWFGGREGGGRGIRWAGNPLVLVFLLGVVLWLGLFGWSLVKLARDHYVSYEGTVVAIERHWTDHLVSESSDVEHLVIRTPEGRLIDRYVSFETRVMSGIDAGDYVVKKRGFGQRVTPRDKDA